MSEVRPRPRHAVRSANGTPCRCLANFKCRRPRLQKGRVQGRPSAEAAGPPENCSVKHFQAPHRPVPSSQALVVGVSWLNWRPAHAPSVPPCSLTPFFLPPISLALQGPPTSSHEHRANSVTHPHLAWRVAASPPCVHANLFPATVMERARLAAPSNCQSLTSWIKAPPQLQHVPHLPSDCSSEGPPSPN